MNDLTYQVVMNQEQQFSIWPADIAIPPGWQALAQTGSKEVCLAYISTTWTDLRPLSLRTPSLGADATTVTP